MKLPRWIKLAAVTLANPGWMVERPSTGGIFADDAGISVTPDSALTASAVYAAVRILSETVASLPLKIYEQKGDQVQLANHPLNNLLNMSSNGEQTSMQLREFQMTCLGLRGNAYSQIVRSGGGIIGELNPLNPKFMNLDRNAAGKLVFDYQETGNSAVYGERDIWRIAGLGTDGVTGLSPVGLARESIGTSLAMESYAAHLFKNGANTNTVLEFPNKLNGEQIEALRNQLAKSNTGHRNSGKPLILESGMTHKSVGMTNDDSQFLESRSFQIAEVARWFHIPLHMLAEMGAATFGNIEHQGIEFVVHTIRPWAIRIEQTIARDLLTPQERQRLHAAHNVDALLRGDTASRYEAHDKAIASGWKNRNEVRAKEGLNRVDGLDEYLLPMNINSISEREKALTTAAANNLAEREVKALKAEASRLTAAEFAAWVPGFYQRHAATIADTLAIDPTKAKAYAAERLASICELTDPIQATHETSAMLAIKIEALT